MWLGGCWQQVGSWLLVNVQSCHHQLPNAWIKFFAESSVEVKFPFMNIQSKSTHVPTTAMPTTIHTWCIQILHNLCNVEETSNFPALLWQPINLNYLCEIRSHPLNMIRWALELVWTFCRWKNSLPLLGIKAQLLGCLACSLVTIMTELPWLYYICRILPLAADNYMND